jgi:hypothetical protein
MTDKVRIVVVKRVADYHASIGGTGCWGCGATHYEAIGDLVFHYPERFSVDIKLDWEA